MEKRNYSFFWEQEGELKNSNNIGYKEALEIELSTKPVSLGRICPTDIEMRKQYIQDLIDLNEVSEAVKEFLLNKVTEEILLSDYTNYCGD